MEVMARKTAASDRLVPIKRSNSSKCPSVGGSDTAAADRKREAPAPVLPEGGVAADVEMDVGKQGKKATTAARPPVGLKRDENGQPKVLQQLETVDADEQYGSQERALCEFLKLHPMLSLRVPHSNPYLSPVSHASAPRRESTSHTTMQLVANLVDKASIPTRTLEIVPKSHDDSMLRPANVAIGERACVLAERCICVWMARWRYGPETNMAFVGAEFLLPSEQKTFVETGKLPATHGKCLVCSRYMHTYIYRAARSDPSFRADERIPLQAYGNSMGHAVGEDFPTHTSVVSDADGYRPEAMLFVDETWSDSAAARSSMGTYLWRPVVKFYAPHYRYVITPEDDRPRLVQVGVGMDEEAERRFVQRFREPALATAKPRSAPRDSSTGQPSSVQT